MSKKIKAISDMVFYSQQNPQALAELIAEQVEDVLTGISIKGALSIEIPESDNVTEDYVAKALSQYGDEMSNTVTLALKEQVSGVSISTNTVTVTSSASKGSFVIKATCGDITKELTVELTKSE